MGDKFKRVNISRAYGMHINQVQLDIEKIHSNQYAS